MRARRPSRRTRALATALALGLPACSPSLATPPPRTAPRAGARPAQDAPFTDTIDLRISALQTALPLYPMAGTGGTRARLRHPKIRLARDGALEFHYGSGFGRAGWRFNPVTTSGSCVTAYNEFVIRRDTGLRDQVLRRASALLARGERTSTGLVWRYPFPHPAYRAGAGWISGMAQGLAIGCLTAANLLSGEPRYLEGAAKAFASLRAPFGDDGTAVPAGDGVYYEEVAGRGSRPSHILNGMIFALGGVWLLHQVDPRPEYEAALREGIAGVRALIDSYDAPGASLYDLARRHVAPIGGYNLRHVQQLQWLYEQGRDPHFLETALRFLGFERRLPFTLTATASPPLPPGARAPDNDGRCWAAPAGARVTLVATLAEPALVDEIGLIACGERTAPARVTAVTGAGSVPLSRPGRLSVIRLPARVLASVRLELVPAEGSHVAISLVSLSSPALRSLTALSSDIGAYWDRARSPLNVSDGRAETSWSTARDDPWLLVGLGETGSAQLALEPCRDRPRALEWAFSPDLERWTRPLPVESVRGTRLPVPDGARFLLLRWSGKGGCLAGIRGLS